MRRDRSLHRKHPLKPGLGVTRATDISSALNQLSLYHVLVRDPRLVARTLKGRRSSSKSCIATRKASETGPFRRAVDRRVCRPSAAA
jgi:DICT domain-containing protein